MLYFGVYLVFKILILKSESKFLWVFGSFEVFGKKFTKFNLALKWLMRNFLKLVQSLLMMFLTIWQENFLVVKSLMGTPVDWNFFTRKFVYTRDSEAQQSKSAENCGASSL